MLLLQSSLLGSRHQRPSLSHEIQLKSSYLTFLLNLCCFCCPHQRFTCTIPPPPPPNQSPLHAEVWGTCRTAAGTAMGTGQTCSPDTTTALCTLSNATHQRLIKFPTMPSN